MTRNILITGADGFIGKNLLVTLNELREYDVLKFTRNCFVEDLKLLIERADFVFHLAGANRPPEITQFTKDNTDLTKYLCDLVESSGRQIPILFTSSTQAEFDNPYGQSKKAAENYLLDFSKRTKNPVYIYQLPGVFGKWCRPNYNSVVATFCYNVAHGLPIKINDPAVRLKLVYIDDVIAEFVGVLKDFSKRDSGYCTVEVEYLITVGEIANLLYQFNESRGSLITERVGAGFVRALYSTYITYLDAEQFSYLIPKHEDSRGIFVEMLKTQDSGQMSYFTAPPGITRGEHYHHTKTEKFLVLKGEAKFRFKHIVSGKYYEIETQGNIPQVVETIPGWAHDITNIGSEEMIVMLWANEIFDRMCPDTIAYKVVGQ